MANEKFPAVRLNKETLAAIETVWKLRNDYRAEMGIEPEPYEFSTSMKIRVIVGRAAFAYQEDWGKAKIESKRIKAGNKERA